MELQWPLMLFTTFTAWCAGLFGTQAALALNGKAQKSQLTAWVVAAVLLVVGGIAVFLHLEHWERIMNGFGHITSGITQELIAIIVLGIVAIVYLVCMRKSESGASVPQPVAIVAIVVSVLLLVIMAHSYMMASRPTWNSVLWVIAVIGEACVLGPATMALIMWLRKDDLAAFGRLPLWGAVINLVTAVLYSVFVQMAAGAFVNVGYHTDPTEPAAGLVIPANIIAAQAPMTWIGIVLIGAVVPLVAMLLVMDGAGILRKGALRAAETAGSGDAASQDGDAPAAAKDAEAGTAGDEAAEQAAKAEATDGAEAPKAEQAAAPKATFKATWARWGKAALARPQVTAAVTLACGLIGTLCLRIVFYNTGLSIFPFF